MMKRFIAALLALCMLFGPVAAFAEDASTGATERWRNRWNREESSEAETETENSRPSRPSREEKEEEPEEEQEESAESSRDYAELWKEWWEQHRSEGEEPEEDDEDEDDEIAADTGEGPAYVYKDNGFKQYGTIRSLIQYSRPIYLYTTEVLESTLPLETIRRITFVLDPDVFSGSDEGGDDSFVYASERSPEGKTKDGTVFVWVGTAGQGPSSWKDDVEEDLNSGYREDQYYEYEIQVSSETVDGQTTFMLTAYPALEKGMKFAYSRDGSSLMALDGSVFTAEKEGEYRFYLLSENESELARSSRYSVTYGKEEIKSGETAGFETTRRQQNTGRDETGDEEVSFDLLFSEHEVSADGSEKFVYESVADRVEITTRPGANRVEEGIEFEVLTRYREGSRATSAPEFRLYGLAGDDQYVYGVRMDDSGYTTLPSGRYTAALSGEYTLTFAIIDPETQAALQEKSYRMNVAIETEEDEETPDAGETPDTETTYEYTLNVSVSEYDSAAWISTPPAFTLSCGTLDVDGTNYAYAVSIDGADAVACANPYVPTKSVSSSLTFSIIGADGTVYAQSESQPLMLDITAPLLTITLLDGYQMNIVAGDSHSGGCTLTVDGQAISSSAEGADGVYTWTVAGSEAITYAVGSIVVEDAAGNQSSNSVAVTLALGSGTQAGAGSMGALGSVSGSFSSGRGGSDGRSVSHSESTTSVVIAYNAVELVVDDGSMNSLVIGEEALDLSLSRDGADASFTAAFASNGAENDTLILTASDADASARYNWRFTGTVYKKLAASGVDYMVLKVGDSVTSLSTAGFSAGIRYNMYRAQGLASKAFTYDVQMGAPSFGISVTVEGDTYALSSDPGAEYYYYDVYHGPMDQLHLQGN